MFVLGCELIWHDPARTTVNLESHRRAWPASNEPERIFEHVTLEELARFNESCDRLAVLMVQVIANAHQAPRAGRWEGAPERSLPRNESPVSRPRLQPCPCPRGPGSARSQDWSGR